MHFYDVSQIDQVYLTSFLFKQSSYINKQLFNVPLHQSLRLKIVNEIVSKNKGLKDFPIEAAYPVIRSCVSASVADQRESAKLLTVQLYKTLGWKKVEPLV